MHLSINSATPVHRVKTILRPIWAIDNRCRNSSDAPMEYWMMSKPINDQVLASKSTSITSIQHSTPTSRIWTIQRSEPGRLWISIDIVHGLSLVPFRPETILNRLAIGTLVQMAGSPTNRKSTDGTSYTENLSFPGTSKKLVSTQNHCHLVSRKLISIPTSPSNEQTKLAPRFLEAHQLMGQKLSPAPNNNNLTCLLNVCLSFSNILSISWLLNLCSISSGLN